MIRLTYCLILGMIAARVLFREHEHTHAQTQRQLAERLHAYFDSVGEAKWDLWKGGTSKTGLLMGHLFANPGPARAPEQAHR